MKTTLTKLQAAQILIDDEFANWSRPGAFALAEYLENREEETGEEVRFCAVALRCDYSEYAGLSGFREEHFADDEQAREAIGFEDETDEDEIDDRTREYIRDRGELIEFDGGIIVSSF